ncbi:hypothetical protein QW131_15755 [Roseibium salinum]|nr:hypothetical protein [Roseibium salinum]
MAFFGGEAGVLHRPDTFQGHASAERSVKGPAIDDRVQVRAGHDARALPRPEAAEDVEGAVVPDGQPVVQHLGGEPGPAVQVLP